MTPEDEFDLYERQKSWAAIFQRIHSTAQKEHNYSLKDARRPEFRSRNRYGDVSPYDHSRVRLARDDIDYINASLVKSPKADRAYILTQGPLPDTAGHFWLMVWEQNSRAILMLNSIIEKGHVKCHQYYPLGEENEDEEEKVFEDVGLKVTYITELEARYHYTARVYQLQDLRSQESKQVIQFHYTAWLDFAVPESGAFLDFLFAVRNSGALDDADCPPVIHCSAGIGRSGTFCLIDTCLILIQRQNSMEGISVIDILMEMRRYRMGLIQTPQQLRFSFEAIIDGAKQLLDIPATSSNGDSALNTTDEEVDPREAKSHSDIELDEDSDSLPNTPPPVPPRTGPSAPRSPFPNTSARNANETVPSDADVPTSNDTDSGLLDSGGASGSVINGADGGLRNGGGNGLTNGVSGGLTNGTDGGLRNGVDGAVANGTLPVDKEPETNQSDGVADHEIRRRKREERIKNTSEQIAKMKQRQKESELWRSREQKLKPYVVGLLAAFAIGGYALYRYYWT